MDGDRFLGLPPDMHRVPLPQRGVGLQAGELDLLAVLQVQAGLDQGAHIDEVLHRCRQGKPGHRFSGNAEVLGPDGHAQRVPLPLTFPGIFSAIILTFIPALGIYTVTDMLGGGKVLYIGNIIKNQFGAIRNWPLGAALSVLLLAITALLIFIYMRFAKLEDMEVV